MGHIIVLCTGSEGEATRIAKTLVEEHFVACANVIDAESFFWWNGHVQEEKEKLLIMKTREDVWDNLRDRIKELHSYELPEIIAVPVKYGLEDYLRWIEDMVGEKWKS
ncbi:MAG: divalent-cation tolerance protein CutA [Thermoplasmata archaeon]|nr:MAG: divalent-cation tolerance protein CutA [Thermoplasmata archaeon]